MFSILQGDLAPTLFPWFLIAILDSEEGKQVMKEAHVGVRGHIS